ncbi:hypothetical protein [Vibrio olivae]|uniref:Uncharacterized protein n=1 Tax=Vibrio olivae TaxID=1243002 RepID=A0ABV5HTV7_9VIBR
MSKYQFFCKPNDQRNDFTYLHMEDEQFVEQKAQLLAWGFEVEGDVIHASHPNEAIDKFESDFIYASEEYSNAQPAVGLYHFVMETYKQLVSRFHRG